MAAAALVQDGETIAIDASIFSRYLLRALGKFKELTVITYNLDCALELKGRSGNCVLIPGGRINPGSLGSNLFVEGDFFMQNRGRQKRPHFQNAEVVRSTCHLP